MKRTVSARLEIDVSGPVRGILSLAVAAGHRVEERLTVERAGAPVAFVEVVDLHGTRLHVFDAEAGTVSVRYAARVEGRADAPPSEAVDAIRYLRPSRYCESDTLLPTATEQFAGLTGLALVDGVAAWVGGHLTYLPGVSGPKDGATATMLARAGVCRDFAHLVVALLRALDVPARVTAVYAPGLAPMDFHAVAEALVDGRWWVVDATGLAPRQTLLRIATGRDAADTAFLTTVGEPVELTAVEVTATVDELPVDTGGPVRLG